MIEPLMMTFEVDCPAEHAFEVWTKRTSSWWPPTILAATFAGACVYVCALMSPARR